MAVKMIQLEVLWAVAPCNVMVGCLPQRYTAS